MLEIRGTLLIPDGDRSAPECGEAEVGADAEVEPLADHHVVQEELPHGVWARLELVQGHLEAAVVLRGQNRKRLF